jgi:hypothetical protein
MRLEQFPFEMTHIAAENEWIASFRLKLTEVG